MRLIYRVIILACLAAACSVVRAQTTLDWSVDFTTVFDNREGDRTHTPPETIFFTRLRPAAGLTLGGDDSFAVGLQWLQPISGDWSGPRVRPIAYYRHEGVVSGSIGIFPRSQLFEEHPSFMHSDSLEYFNPDIRGALLQWHSGPSFAEIYIDWRQMRTHTRREAFTIAAHARWKSASRPWMAGAYAAMNHLALTSDAPPDMNIADNLMAAPYIGADFSRTLPLDSLRLRAGAVVNIDRDRADMRWHQSAGGWVEAIAAWKRVELKNMLYAGMPLLPSYGRFRGQLFQGEPFYAARFYNRTELSYRLVSRRHVDLRAGLDFNFSPGSFIFYQKIALRITFGQSHRIGPRD